MTFFFQRNPIGVILKIVLALLCVIIAVGGCFCSTAQKTSNKVCASIIKRASHSSGAWINLEALFASCSKSLCICKKNIHISNVINAYLSHLLTVVRRSCSDGWCGTYASRLWDMLVLRVCLQEQRKQSLLTLAKENQSPLGWYPNPPTFLFTNPCFVLLIHDLCFVLSLHSSLITQRDIRLNDFHLWQLDEVREMYFIMFEIWIFLTPRSRVRHVLLWMRALYLTYCGLFNRNTRPLQW